MDSRFPGFQKNALCHKLTAFVSAADPKSQKNGLRWDRVFAPTNVGARTKLKGAERELRNTAVFATGDCRAKRHPRPPNPVFPSKLPTVRPAHTHAELILESGNVGICRWQVDPEPNAVRDMERHPSLRVRIVSRLLHVSSRDCRGCTSVEPKTAVRASPQWVRNMEAVGGDRIR